MKSKKELAAIALILISSSTLFIILAYDFLPMLIIGVLNGIAGILSTIAAIRKSSLKQ